MGDTDGARRSNSCPLHVLSYLLGNCDTVTTVYHAIANYSTSPPTKSAAWDIPGTPDTPVSPSPDTLHTLCFACCTTPLPRAAAATQRAPVDPSHPLLVVLGLRERLAQLARLLVLMVWATRL